MFYYSNFLSTCTSLITGLDEKPKLSELQKYVRPVAAEKWEDVGIALGLADDDDGMQLDNIKEEEKGNSNQCFNKLMKLWLRSGADNSHCTWAALFTALKNVAGLENTAEQIEKQILTTSKPAEVQVYLLCLTVHNMEGELPGIFMAWYLWSKMM